MTLQEFLSNTFFDFISLCSQEYMDKIDLKLMFPNFFGFVYKFSKSHGWDLHMSGASPTRGVMPPTNSEEHLSISVEECSFVEPIAKALPQSVDLQELLLSPPRPDAEKSVQQVLF